jgi:hypothetical protein
MVAGEGIASPSGQMGQGLNVMSTAEYQMATQMGVFPFLQR